MCFFCNVCLLLVKPQDTHLNISNLCYFLETGKGGEFAKSSESDETTADKENVQSTVPTVHAETTGEVTMDSKTGNNNSGCPCIK